MNTKYRIDFFNQIKCYYSIVFSGDLDIRPVHTSLYMFLLNQNNRLDWCEWFKCPFDIGMVGSQINSKNTYYKALNDLVSFDLIKYEKGLNSNKTPKISIKILDSTVLKINTVSEQVSDTVSGKQGEQVTEPLSEQLSGNIYKLITTNIKTINFKHKEVEAFFIDLVKKDESLFEDLKPEIKYPYTSDEFLANWRAWKKYKKEQKKFKWSVESEQAALLKLSKISKTDSEAVEIIQESMANGWAGLFELKNKTNGTEQKSPAEQFAEIYNSDAAKNFRFSPDNNR